MSKVVQVPEGWEEKPLEYHAEVVGGGTPSRDNEEYWKNATIFWATPTDITGSTNSNYVTETSEKITEEGLKGSSAKMLPENSILLTSRATIGAMKINTVPMATNQGFASIVSKRDNGKFLFYLLHQYTQYMSQRAYGTTFPEISKTEVKKIIVIAPKSIEEQHRIAEILSTLDRTIEASEKLIAKEKQIKKGLMNDLLTHGIDEMGRIRTPQTHRYKESELGMIPEGWGIGNVKLLVKNLDSQRVPIKEADRQDMNGQYPYYGASGVIDWVNDYLFNGDFILLGEDGENVVSRVLPLAFKASGKIWVNNHAHVFKPLDGVDIDYVVSLLESTDYKRIINGSAQPKITQDGLERIQFRIAAKQEQQRIAKVLTTQDKKIETEKANLAKLKELKKGLMDDLLSGRVRVEV